MHINQSRKFTVSVREHTQSDPETTSGGSISIAGAVLIGLTIGLLLLISLVCLFRARSRPYSNRVTDVRMRETGGRTPHTFQVCQHCPISSSSGALFNTINAEDSRASWSKR